MTPATLFLFLFLLISVAALTERYLEARAFVRLTSSETFASLGDARVRYRMLGDAQPGTAVVFINGMVASLEQWDRVQRHVAEFAPTVSYDRGGFGFTRGSSAYSVVQQAEELCSLLDALSVKSPVLLVGYSTAGSLMRVFVSRHRARVAGLVLIEPYLPELEAPGTHHHGPLRTYARPMLDRTVTTLLGVRRLQAAWQRRRAPRATSPLEERSAEILLRFPCWWAAAREWLLTGDTRREVLGASPLGDIPVVLLSGNLWGEGEAGQLRDSIYRTFLAQSPQGELRKVPSMNHDAWLETDDVIDAIRDVQTLHPRQRG